MAIFFQKKTKKLPSGRGLCPQTPMCGQLSCTGMLTAPIEMSRFSNKKVLTLSSCPSLSKILVERLQAST